ncbi:MAG: hypothetical protein N3A72_00550 [bacterium]|nr:hypothetical protein [bacterium]
MRVSVIVTSIIWTVVFLVGAYAQEKAVVLEYNYQVGEVMKYQMTGKGNGTMNISGLENQRFGMFTASSMPITLNLQGYIIMSTKNVDTSGTAELEMMFDKLIENMEFMGQRIVITINSGEFEMSVNNQLMFSSKSATKPFPFLGQPISMKVTKTGQMLEFSGMEQLKELMPGLSRGFDFNDMTKNMPPVLPEHPVNVGEVWSSTTQIKLPFMQEKSAQVMKESTLLSIETVSGKRYAVITLFEKMLVKDWKLDRVNSENSYDTMPEMKFNRMEQMVLGKVKHSLDAGRMIKSEYTQNMFMEMNMNMAIPTQVKPMDMTMKMNIAMDMVIELK